MILKNFIDIPEFDCIQKKLQDILVRQFDGANKEAIGFIEDEVIKTEVPELYRFFEQNNLIPECFAVLIRDPHVTAPIHVDGDGSRPVVLAINLPVFNCENTYMYWFDVPPDQLKFIEDRGNRYKSLPLDYDWTKITPLETLELTKPCMVRINVPHNIVNDRDTVRAILSIRFNPAPFHMWPESITDSFWQGL